jgi:light-regulated signal transduction histidine kinase (bacteriophytochrome)
MVPARDEFIRQSVECLRRIRSGANRMEQLITDLLRLSQVAKAELRFVDTDLSAVAREILDELAQADPTRQVETVVQEGVVAHGEPQLLRIALENLLGNAWKYTSSVANPRIEFGATGVGGPRHYFVRDNGAGFDMKDAGRLFEPFQRLHSSTEFPGTGVGLATVKRVVDRHAGRIWAQASPKGGATFFFQLHAAERAAAGSERRGPSAPRQLSPSVQA